MKQNIYRVKTDGFHGELFIPKEDKYPGKALICFSGSDGKFELTRMLAGVFQSHGLTTLAFAYVKEVDCHKNFLIFLLICWRRRQSGCMIWDMKR